MAEEERVAAGERPEALYGGVRQLAAEDSLQQLVHGWPGQWRELQPREVFVLPQRCDRVRSRLAVAQGQHSHPVPGDQPVHEHRRDVVEQVGVVDAEYGAATVGAAGQMLRRTGEGVGVLRPDTVEKAAERGEWISRADSVASAQCEVPPRRATSSRASRVFPTPAGPQSTMPGRSPRGPSALPATRSSSSRPTNGQDRGTEQA